MNEFRTCGFALPLLGLIVLLGNAMEASLQERFFAGRFLYAVGGDRFFKRSRQAINGAERWGATMATGKLRNESAGGSPGSSHRYSRPTDRLKHGFRSISTSLQTRIAIRIRRENQRQHNHPGEEQVARLIARSEGTGRLRFHSCRAHQLRSNARVCRLS